MKTGRAGIELIKQFEGLRTTAYPDPATGGEPWSIGHGHTSRAGPPKVTKGMKISADDAGDILVADLAKFESEVRSRLTRSPTQNQFDAMVSLCLNIGPGNFAKSSVLKYFNAGKFDRARDSFVLWNKANGRTMKGLTRRREAEAEMFGRPAAQIVAPEPLSPVLPPDLPDEHETPPVAAPWSLWGALRKVFGR